MTDEQKPAKATKIAESEAVGRIIGQNWQHRHQWIKGLGWMHLPRKATVWRLENDGASIRSEVRQRFAPDGIDTNNKIKGVVAQTSCEPQFREGEFDANPVICGLPNGDAIHLETGETIQGDAELRISKRLGAAPAEGEPTRWLQYLEEVLPAADDRAWLCRYLGYCLTAHTREHVFVYLVGGGRNGKGILMRVMQLALGEYQTGIDADKLVGIQETHSTWLAALAGARLATADEMMGGTWNTYRIKQLVAGDKQTARVMRQDQFDFMPKCKLILAGNQLPSFEDSTYAMKERMKIIRFSRTFLKEQRDVKLAEKLKAELPQIVGWLVDQAQAYFADGLLDDTANMESEIDTLFARSNPVRAWANEFLRFHSDAFTASDAMLESLERNAKVTVKRLSGEVLKEIKDAAKRHEVTIEADKKMIDGVRMRGFHGVELKENANVVSIGARRRT